jgi:2-polyprenyl-3-methyl-5-hydroxy-6-metoxy-1,4-benzoquinol methylase
MCAYSEWDKYYRSYPLDELGWELGKPRPVLVEFVEKGLIKAGRALDLCCGAGTNTVYLAKKGFDVAGIDISLTALGIAKTTAKHTKVHIGFLQESFVDLAFADGVFDFVFDMGCFHHVEIEDRNRFIAGINRVLKEGGQYMLTCFSYKNGPGWNHFTRQQIIDLFSRAFNIESLQHISSLEGDGVIRFFYTVLMRKKVGLFD